MSNSKNQQAYSRLDIGFAQFLGKRCHLDTEQRMAFEHIVLKLSAEQLAGHSCIFLNEPEQALVKASGLASENQLTPLILDENRLYLHRYWHYEQRLAKQLFKLSQSQIAVNNLDSLLAHYFPKQSEEIDWQKQAAEKALSQSLTIITGGPGTGKTTTVVKIIALLQEINQNTLQIALAAPTGKAAMRLQEAIVNNKAALPCQPQIKARIPEQVSTLHRLLGPKPPTPYFKHSESNPLPYDLVIIDECSMVDLALMSKLVDALKPKARLILLGDKDQLSSVEAGAVLADLTQSLVKNTAELIKSHRFQGEIKALADAINQQNTTRAWQCLQSNNPEIGLLTEKPIEYIVQHYLDYLQLISTGASFMAIFAAFNRFKVLCSNQKGKYSVSDINTLVEQQLAKLNKIKLHSLWYSGRPVMITSNNASLQLYNGDIGICLKDDASDGQLSVFFLTSDNKIKKVNPARIPEAETVYAMTIHKSQGSEFEQVLIMLPEHDNPVLSKELIYTAITRAKKQVKIACNQKVFMHCISKKVDRQSGLAKQLINLQTNI